jgi:uncharacterized protein
MKSIFVGPNGLRAGWRALVFVAIVLAASALAQHVLGGTIQRQLTATGGVLGPRLALLIELFTAILPVVLATGVMALAERRSFWSYGLTDSALLQRFGWGTFWGFVMLSGLVALLMVTGHLAFDGTALTGLAAVRFAIEWGVLFAIVAVAEEMTFRGYLQQTLGKSIGFWPAAVILSLGFAAAHLTNSGEAVIGIVQVATAGLVFCYSLYRTGSLWWAIGAHLGWDWAQSYFYGVPDSGILVSPHLLVTHPLGAVYLSGGTVGPEGSIFVVLAELALALVVYVTLRRSHVPE